MADAPTKIKKLSDNTTTRGGERITMSREASVLYSILLSPYVMVFASLHRDLSS
jgi:hypothetical protein